MKKLISVLLVLAMVLSLAACGSSSVPASSAAPAAPAASGDASGSAPASKGEWPSKAITLLCGYSAGGSSDLGCRYVAEALKRISAFPLSLRTFPAAAAGSPGISFCRTQIPTAIPSRW